MNHWPLQRALLVSRGYDPEVKLIDYWLTSEIAGTEWRSRWHIQVNQRQYTVCAFFLRRLLNILHLELLKTPPLLLIHEKTILSISQVL